MNNAVFLDIHFLGYSLYSPNWLWLLLIVPILLYFNHLRLKQSKGAVKFSLTLSELKSISFRPIQQIIIGSYAAIGLGLCFLIVAMAQPYSSANKQEKKYGKGIDIMIALDVSGSMMATDFLPNRLEAAKDVAIEFINHRKTDQIGFVAFSGEAYTVCPPTQDYHFLKHKISKVQAGIMTQGTAIGVGLGTAISQIYKDSITSKVVILLTDGVNNVGQIKPMEAAELAKKNNITVYTIGVGKKGYVEMPINTPFGVIKQRNRVNIDEGLLTQIAKTTGGKYFRAVDKNSLRKIYKKINQMETTKIVSNTVRRQPPFRPSEFLYYGLILLLIGTLVEQLILKYDA